MRALTLPAPTGGIDEDFLRKPLAKLDLSKHALLTPTEYIHVTTGTALRDLFETIEIIGEYVTNSERCATLKSAIQLVALEGTAVMLDKPMWRDLPTISNYVDVDTLEDDEETRELVFKSLRRQGW
ncbi:MAG: hypothetical protein AB7F59_15030 [Bdellovibrionales bacterium]